MGGELSDSDLRALGFVTGRFELEGFGRVAAIAGAVRTHAPFYRVGEIDRSEVDVEVDQAKDNQRLLRETLDRARSQDGSKVLLDAFYRKKLLEYANVFARQKDRMDLRVAAHAQRFARVHNDTLSFELDVLPQFLVPDEDAPRECRPGAAFARRAHILLLFRGASLEAIYAALEADGSAFARRCAAVMRSRDQNLLRANLHLVRAAVDSSFAQCLANELRTANLLVARPDLCPGLFERSADFREVFRPDFDPRTLCARADDSRR